MHPLLKIGVSALVLQVLATIPCRADTSTDTLGKIKATGIIAVGYRPASVPFSMRGADGGPVGYTIDLCEKIVDNVKREMALPQLQVKYVPVSSGDRMGKLLDGEIDIECGSTTNTRDRQLHVAFVNTIFVTSTRILARADSHIKDISELKGRRVAIAQNASVAPLITKIDLERKLDIQYVRVKDFSEGFQVLESGKADAFVSDDIQFAAFLTSSSHPQDFAVVGEPISVDPLGIMVRKDDVQLRYIANRTLADLIADGEFNRIYSKWFLTKQIKFPMNDALKNLLKAPNSQANY